MITTYPLGNYSYTLWHQTPNGHRFSSVSYQTVNAATAGAGLQQAIHGDLLVILHRVKPHDVDGAAMWTAFTSDGEPMGTYPTKWTALNAAFGD